VDTGLERPFVFSNMLEFMCFWETGVDLSIR
jgi:hypothetical protein